jgi:hypothetical protein
MSKDDRSTIETIEILRVSDTMSKDCQNMKLRAVSRGFEGR